MRVIARLDIKNEFVIKGIHLEGLRKVGDPIQLALKYYEQGIDEIVFMDAVASLYDRNNLFHVIEEACKQVFVPITIGGGIRSLDDIEKSLHAGADKVAINTAAVHNPELIGEAALKYGSQCVVASIEAKKSPTGWEAYIDNGREKTGIDVVQWVRRLEDLGAGEILLTSVDMEGTKKGFDVDLVEAVCDTTSVPVIVSGGLGQTKHITNMTERVMPSAISCAGVLHYDLLTVNEIKTYMNEHSLDVRP
ncbi:imidazole glycerol phosphate synthase subunit HisF [Emcibacter sp.]|uniref:imidazole glycerol phosphate synthase subunit HisF n=1 Tax=Emcibacter sp. TaxID=1979954 RepID=UPI003A95A4F8